MNVFDDYEQSLEKYRQEIIQQRQLIQSLQAELKKLKESEADKSAWYQSYFFQAFWRSMTNWETKYVSITTIHLELYLEPCVQNTRTLMR